MESYQTNRIAEQLQSFDKGKFVVYFIDTDAGMQTDYLGSTGTRTKRMPLMAKYASPGEPPLTGGGLL